MYVSPVNNASRPSFNGQFIKTQELETYINSMNKKEFDTFKKSYDVMEGIEDDKKYRYTKEKHENFIFGCIIDEKGNYIAREIISILNPRYGTVASHDKVAEKGLFDEVFNKYEKLHLNDRKSSFLNSLE